MHNIFYYLQLYFNEMLQFYLHSILPQCIISLFQQILALKNKATCLTINVELKGIKNSQQPLSAFKMIAHKNHALCALRDVLHKAINTIRMSISTI